MTGADRGVQLGDRRVQRLDHPQVLAQQDAMVRPDMPGHRSPERVPLRAQPRVGQRHQAVGIGLARRQGRHDRPATDAEQRAEDRSELHVGALQDLLDPLTVRGHLPPELLARPGQLAQRLNRHGGGTKLPRTSP